MLTIKIERDGDKITSAEVVDFNYKTRPLAGYENRNGWKSLAEVESIAALLGAEYIGTDAGEYVSPRFDVIARPKVGDSVSYSFNGDYYPCGKITRVSAAPDHRRIEAKDENGRKSVFYRQGKTGCWKMKGTWSLVHGTIDKRNPEF